MANPNSSTVATSSTSAKIENPPCHRAFSLLARDVEHNEEAQFAAQVYEVSRGALVIANIMRQNALDLGVIIAGNGAALRPLLSEGDADALAGLVEFSLLSLRDTAERRVDSFNNQALKGA